MGTEHGRTAVRVLATSAMLVGALGAGELFAGCDGLLENPAADAGPLPPAPVARDASVREAGKPPREPFVGWGTFDEYDGCNLLVPGTRGDLPPPFRWGPCPMSAQTAGLACREMVLDWETRLSEWITPAIAIRRRTGAIALMAARHEVTTSYAMIADLDGPVHVAVRYPSGHCVLSPGASDGEHYFWRVVDTTETTDDDRSRHDGAIGGSLAELIPRVLLQYADVGRDVYTAGGLGFVERGATTGTRISPWNLGGSVHDLTAIGLRGRPSFAGDHLLWVDDSTSAAIWGPSSGANVLLSNGDSVTRGVAGLATDGKDMVWIEGSQPVDAGGTDIYGEVAIMTSPFATSASQLVPKVLRSDLSGYAWASKIVVGCGHAARSGYLKSTDGSLRGGTIVTRLSDGHAWLLPNGPGLDFGWRTPLAITCDEVFVIVSERPGDSGLRVNVAAVRLDSLGASLPP